MLGAMFGIDDSNGLVVSSVDAFVDGCVEIANP